MRRAGSMRQTIISAGVVLLTAGLSACAALPASVDPLAGQRLTAPPIDFGALLTHPDRPVDDFKEDRLRKPDEVLAFAGLTHGMTVVEMEAGGGYYTELLSHGVGAEGKVFMQNPAALDVFFGDDIKERLEGERLSNVQALRTNFDELIVADASVDLVTWVLGPHELWFQPENAPKEAFGNPDKAFAEIVRVLKPGGTFVVIDHAAPDGAPPESGSDTHRIDPKIVKTYASRVGLELVETTDILANEEDDGTLSVFDSSLRRQTNRFVFKFHKAS